MSGCGDNDQKPTARPDASIWQKLLEHDGKLSLEELGGEFTVSIWW